MTSALNYNYSSPNNSKAFETKTIKALEVAYDSPPFAQHFFPDATLLAGTHYTNAFYTQVSGSASAISENNGIYFSIGTVSPGFNTDHNRYENGVLTRSVRGQGDTLVYDYPVDLDKLEVQIISVLAKTEVTLTQAITTESKTAVIDYDSSAGGNFTATFPFEFESWKSGWLVPSELQWNIALRTDGTGNWIPGGPAAFDGVKFVIMSTADAGGGNVDVTINDMGAILGGIGPRVDIFDLSDTLLDTFDNDNGTHVVTLPAGEEVKFQLRLSNDVFHRQLFVKNWTVALTSKTSVELTKSTGGGKTLLSASGLAAGNYSLVIDEDATAGTDVPDASTPEDANGGRIYDFGSTADRTVAGDCAATYPQDRRNRELQGLF